MAREGRHAVPRSDHVPFWSAVLVTGTAVLAMSQLVWDLGFTVEGPPFPNPQGAVVMPSPANGGFAGVTTFRGNATRSYYGEGPVPAAPVIRWRAPVDGSKMCSLSAEGRDPSALKEWCGTGWPGQPNVVPAPGGVEVRDGAYDGAYHFLEGGSGAPVRPELATGDLAKGSATTDPDGYPLYYAGSRDNLFRIVATDRQEPTVLWTLDSTTSVPRPLWNDDWDGAALVVQGHLLVGGENGWFYVIRLNRGYDVRGQVTVAPRVIAGIQGFDDELLEMIGDEDVSIEGSVAFHEGVAYFANSGGLVQGWDISDILGGGDRYVNVFRYWTGDDTDATIVIDEQGALYVASEFQRFNERGRTVGQLMKLDPRSSGDPLVWSLPAMEIGFDGAGGSWSTPAIYGDYVYFTTAAGRVLGVERSTGHIVWEMQIGAPTIGSPVVVDAPLIQGDCTGHLYAWDVSDPTVTPPLSWKLDLGDCIESTPAVWRGWIYVGTREGFLYGVADQGVPPPDS